MTGTSELKPSQTGTPLGPGVLELDLAAEVERICAWMVGEVSTTLHRRGVVVAMSGGVDSSVCAALAVRAFGPRKVYGLLLPERDSKDAASDLGLEVAEHLGLPYELFNISPTLEAIGCYRLRDDAIRAVFPDYAEDWKCKVAIAGGRTGGINFFKLIVEAPDGRRSEARLPLREYLQVVAATSFKQRIRKTLEYYHADRLNFAVIGTPNRLEYDQGFFVKNGDGAADLKPIAHLFKTQIYALARYLELPDDVCAALPTTDTYSLVQGQDEFYFALPYDQMDLALWAHNHGRSEPELVAALSISQEHARIIYADIEAKRRTTHYQHARPLLVEPILEVSG
jgi:NAD+ synthase